MGMLFRRRKKTAEPVVETVETAEPVVETVANTVEPVAEEKKTSKKSKSKKDEA